MAETVIREVRRVGRKPRAKAPAPEMLAVLCWCEKTVVKVSAQDVWDGLTGTCEECE